MFVNEFESSNAYRLQQIMSTLKSVHGIELDLDSKDADEIQTLGESSEIIKNSIVKESAFNSWMQNPEYTKQMLIMEAVRIYLTEIAPKRTPRRKVKESQQVEEGPRGKTASRDWSLNKMSKPDARYHEKSYLRPGDKSKPDAREELEDLMRKYLGQGGEIKKVAEGDPANTVQMGRLGSAMMDYAQNAEHKGDERELRILNAISQVGDKLTQVGTPFGPRQLTDLDKKVIQVAKRRMGYNAVMEDPVVPTSPNAPGNAPQLAPGMIKVKKGTDEKTIPAAQLANLQKQGYSVVGDEPIKEDDLAALMKKYGVTEDTMQDQDGDGDEDFADVMIARMTASGMPKPEAIAKTKSKPYNKESISEKKQTKDLHKLSKRKDELEHKMDKITKDGGRILRNDPLRVEYEKVVSDIRKAKSAKLEEAAHMEHDSYQASMARSELYRNTKYAMDMMKMIGPEDEIKPWVAANLAKAAQALDKIYHYMDYYMTFEPSQLQDVKEDSVTADADGTVGSVARQNLLMIMEYSTKLFRMIQPGDKLEGWVAMKLTNASESISSSKHYMDYAQFEKHMGHEMDAVVDQPVEMPAQPVDEDDSNGKQAKKKKKNIKEGRMVTIGNILMTAMLKEEQDLAQAQTLLAAKAMSDELQGIAEKVAKMSVEDLMPVVDTMKQQFGQAIADGFNSTMKAALDAVLSSTTSAKESADNAILNMQQGQVPGTGTTDIEADMPQEEPSEVEPEAEDEFKGTPAAAGEPEEPLGRAKKPETAPEELEEAKKAKEHSAVATAQVMKMGGKFVTKDKDHLTKAGITKRDEIIKAMEKAQKLEEAKKAKPGFLDVDKDGNKKELMKKALKDKAKKTVNESYKSVDFNPNMGSLALFDPKLGALAKNIEAAIDAEQNLTDKEKGALANILSHMAGFASDPRGWEDAEEKMTNAINAAQHALDPRKPEAKKIINAMKKLAHGISFKHEDSVIEGKKAKPDFLDVDKDGNKKESFKKALNDKAENSKVDPEHDTAKPPRFKMVYCSQCLNGFGPGDAGYSHCKDHRGKTAVFIKEAAPPGKKAEDFIKKNKASFKKRYGDKGEEVLYATAWKKFGKKEESAIKVAKMLEAAKANKIRLEKLFEAHKKQFSKMVSEGIAVDPLGAGYGLQGQTLLDQITDVDGMIEALKGKLRIEMQEGIHKLVAETKQARTAEALASKLDTSPYGVMWTANGSKMTKFFETADLRNYWVDLNKIDLLEAKMINPEDFEARIAKLTRKA